MAIDTIYSHEYFPDLLIIIIVIKDLVLTFNRNFYSNNTLYMVFM